MKRLFILCLMIAMMPGCGCGKTPKEAASKEEAPEGQEVVHLKEESQQLVDLQFVTAKKEPLQEKLAVVGEIAQETENVVHVTSTEPGVLKGYLLGLGEVVEKGKPVCEITTSAGKSLEISSPIHGIVLAQYLKPNDPVDTLTSIMTIANPDVLRASFSVYEKDLAGIKIGLSVSVKSIAYPDKIFEGEIVFISPSVDEKSRTIKIRVNVKNEEHLLKFGMFVTGEILVPVSDPVLTVPDEALQEIKGKRVVFVPKPEEKNEFLIKAVQSGRKTGEQVEILSGLEEGERVVGNGSFYLKSELLKSELEEE